MKRRQQDLEAVRVSFRGRLLDQRQITRIRTIVESGSGWTRQALAREVCRAFRWRLSNGSWAVHSARDLLVRLHSAGVIELPAPRGVQGRPLGEAVRKAASALSPNAGGLNGASASEGPGSRSTLCVRPIRGDEVLVWRAHMERFHYLGDVALVGESLRYVAHLDDELVALLGWGAASLRNGPRESHVGWDEATKKLNLALVVNNVRFLVLPGARQHCLASRVLAANLRRLSRDWEEVYCHPVVLAETFVDISRFRGTCYRASNWVCVGETKGWSRSGASYRFNGQPKAVWLYSLRRDFKKQLCAATGTCTKRRNFVMLDVAKLPLNGQGGLFEILCAFPDSRKRRGIRHKIESILATAICAVLAGARSFTAMAEWAEEQSPETLRRLGSKRGKPPSERTYRRTFDSIDVAELDRRTGEWFAEQQGLQACTGLALDGKTVRGSRESDKPARHLLSAIVHGSGTVVAQVAVDLKTNEITQVAPLLNNLDITGVVVTGDALLTQREIARHIVEDKRADYVLTAKGNQPTLRKDIADLFTAKEQEAKRRHEAGQQPPEQEAFPPLACDLRQGSWTDRDAGDLDQHRAQRLS